ncbi:hypothetical protein F5B19DRAFT_465120 [Rostrohypoxylon terebratum]|nr:hypothetical protein F5B19DRAFT_465120 [Rostrohypoxylon terebratum]
MAGFEEYSKLPSVREPGPLMPDKSKQLDVGDNNNNNTQKVPQQQHIANFRMRGPLQTLPQLKEYLELTFKTFASSAEAILQQRLQSAKKLTIEYKLVGRYPKSLDEQQGARISPCISFTVPSDYGTYRELVLNSQPRRYDKVSHEVCAIVWDFIRMYEYTKNNLAVSWSDILVVELLYELLDGQSEPHRHCTLPQMVYLMTADKQHYALHNTMMADEAKAKYNQNLMFKRTGGS